MGVKPSIKAAVTSIEEAFATSGYPGDDHIAHHQNYNPSDGWNCAEVFRGKAWQDVEPAALIKCAIPFLTPEAFRYFLPAYMLGKLLHPTEADVAGDFIVYSLVPPKEDDHLVAWRKQLEPLTPAQKRAVRMFLEVIANDPDDIFRDAQNALDGFWNKS